MLACVHLRGAAACSRACARCAAADVFLARCGAFAAWLAARPERCIAVVTHWGVIDGLTSLEFTNCEARGPRARAAAACTLRMAAQARADARALTRLLRARAVDAHVCAV
jgi:hypothetical protein